YRLRRFVGESCIDVLKYDGKHSGRVSGCVVVASTTGCRTAHCASSLPPRCAMSPNRVRRLFSTLAALGALPLLAASAQAQNGNISGRVTDSTNNTPVANAQVEAVAVGGRPYATTANSEGVYRIVDIPAGTYTVT